MSREHAVVVGGSLAGLLAARILADHFDRVTVVERDRFPDGAGDRAGVGQGRHLHVLWPYGLELIESMFPGIEKELSGAGAPEVRVPADVLWLTAAGWRRRFDSTRLLTFSRGLLDWTLRKRLASVAFLQGHEVTGLIPAGQGVAGVEVRERGGGTATPLPADLVVDASGRSSKVPDWLARLGFPAPRETHVDPLLGYASRNYAMPSGFDPGWKALYLQADPPGTRRTGGLFPQEGGRWICSLSGAGRDYGPTGEREFLDFAKGLRHPVLYEAIRHAEPLTPIVGYRRTANHRRHYERLPAWPERFIVLGDAVCAFNPIYGQGMSVAAIQAAALQTLLRDRAADGGDLRGLARRFQRLAGPCAAGAWLIATGEDLRYRETEGSPVRLHTKIINRYVDRVIAVANVDSQVCADLMDVLALASAPTALFRPGVLRRVATVRARQPAGPDDLDP